LIEYKVVLDNFKGDEFVDGEEFIHG